MSQAKKKSGRFVIRVPRSIHQALADEAERQGISLNELVKIMLRPALAELTPRPTNHPWPEWPNGDPFIQTPYDDAPDMEGDCPDCEGTGEVACSCGGDCELCSDGARTCRGCDGSGYRDDEPCNEE